MGNIVQYCKSSLIFHWDGLAHSREVYSIVFIWNSFFGVCTTCQAFLSLGKKRKEGKGKTYAALGFEFLLERTWSMDKSPLLVNRLCW